MGSLLYFAYGSNLDVDQMRARCPNARPLARARLRDYRLEFTHLSHRWGGGTADILPSPGEAVWGALYAIDSEELAELDRFEGGYERLEVLVEDGDGKARTAVSYTARSKGEFAPTEEYRSKLLRSAGYWGFPEGYVARLRTTRCAPRRDVREDPPPGTDIETAR